MNNDWLQIINRLSSPLEPLATELSALCEPMEGIRAVLFDIYGTMLISGSGDVGTLTKDVTPTALRAALTQQGIPTDRLAADAGLERMIHRHHTEARARGVDYPEVEITSVWQQMLSEWVQRGELPDDGSSVDLFQLALEYECRVNPVWPMPQLEACLAGLRDRQRLGIVSNAQFFTPWLFPALLGQTLEDLGFSNDMQYFSYEYGVAKPSPRLFLEAIGTLARHGIPPHQAVYVGNDMLNDIATAASVGLRTVLFAGDRRSLRLRASDPRVADCQPDGIITELGQLPDCFS